MIGTTRETVSRVLSEFQKRGLIMMSGKGLAGKLWICRRREHPEKTLRLTSPIVWLTS